MIHKKFLSIFTLQFMLLLLVCSLAFRPTAQASSLSLESYGESISLEGEGGSSSALFLKAHWNHNSTWLPHPYLGFAWEKYSPDRGQVSRYSPMIGAEIRPIPQIKLFAEYRYVSETPKTSYSRNDPRFGLVAGLWKELALIDSINLFSDTYGELITISRISNNPALTAFSKLGPRIKISQYVSSDLFAEAYIRESDDTNLGRRAMELRHGARAILALEKNGQWVLSATAFRRFHTFRDAPAPKWRILFALGGNL